MNLDQDITNLTAKITTQAGIEGIKIGGKLAKELLLILLQKLKDKDKYKSGSIALKKLLKSGEELQSAKLNKEYLKSFQKKAKALGIAYTSISHPEETEARLLFKASQIELVKEVFKDILEEKNKEIENIQGNEKLLKVLDEVIDIPEMGEEKDIYRHEVDDVSLEKAKLISENLKLNNIENSIAVKDIKESDKESNKDAKDLIANLEFKVDQKEKEKAVSIIEELKDKNLEELKEISKKLNTMEIVDNKETRLENFEEDSEERTLADVINEAKEKVNNKNESKDSKTKNKVRKNHEER